MESLPQLSRHKLNEVSTSNKCLLLQDLSLLQCFNQCVTVDSPLLLPIRVLLNFGYKTQTCSVFVVGAKAKTAIKMYLTHKGMEASGGSECFELLKKGKFKFVQSGLNISQQCILVQYNLAADWSRWKSEVCFDELSLQKHCENDQLPLLMAY